VVFYAYHQKKMIPLYFARKQNFLTRGLASAKIENVKTAVVLFYKNARLQYKVFTGDLSKKHRKRFQTRTPPLARSGGANVEKKDAETCPF